MCHAPAVRLEASVGSPKFGIGPKYRQEEHRRMAKLWKWVGRKQTANGRRVSGGESTRSVEVRIGLDVGTANTRCVVNTLGAAPKGDVLQVLGLDEAHDILPTTIAVDGDALLIGSAAEAHDDARRSFLMWLPMLAGERVDTASSGKYDGLQQTVFRLGDHMISAKEVAVLFLERVLGRVFTTLDEQHGAGRWHGTLRVATPAHSTTAYRELLTDITSLAMDMACAAGGRTPTMTQSLAGLTERYQRDSGRSCAQDIRVEVVSAAEAAAVAVIGERSLEAGRKLALVDLGAGATNATICTIEDDVLHIIGSHGCWNGMDDIDQLLATSRAVRRRAPRAFREAEGLRPSDRPMIRRGLDQMVGVLPALLAGLTDRSGTEGWVSRRRAAFDIVLVGGGSSCDLLTDEFQRREQSPMPTVVSFWDVEGFVPASLERLGVIDRRRRKVDDATMALMTVACGLADRRVSVTVEPSSTRERTAGAAINANQLSAV